jgi:hypothetical protein
LEHKVNLLLSFLSEDAFEDTLRTGSDRSAEDFAQQVILTICQASVTPAVGRRAYEQCLRALAMGASARLGFRHPGKAEAIDRVWRERDRLFREYRESPDKLAYLSTLPWIGPVTRNALARRLGLLAGPAHRAAA